MLGMGQSSSATWQNSSNFDIAVSEGNNTTATPENRCERCPMEYVCGWRMIASGADRRAASQVRNVSTATPRAVAHSA